MASSKEFIFTDNDYQQFLNYLKSDDDVFKTETELQFIQALNTSEKGINLKLNKNIKI